MTSTMPAETCVSPVLLFSPQEKEPQQSVNYPYNARRSRRPLEQMQFLISGHSHGGSTVRNVHTIQIKQEPEDVYYSSGGEDKDFGDKWEQISDEKSNSAYASHLEDDSQTSHNHNHNHSTIHYNHHSLKSSRILNYHPHQNSPTYQQSQTHHVLDEASLDSQDTSESSNTASTNAESKEAASFLFVGPLGKKRKYSRQRATSDDNEPETILPTAAGSPETAEEMDESQSPSPGESSQSFVGPLIQSGSPAREHPSPASGSEQVSTIVSTPPSQQRLSVSPPSVGESVGENSNSNMTGASDREMSVVVSKPIPITGAPTSVIRRVNRKKQEHPLPLNLSVSSPPNSSNSYSPPLSILSNSTPTGPSTPERTTVLSRSTDGCTTTPSVVRDELYFEGRSGPGDRQVFVWRYRDEAAPSQSIPNAVAGSVSPASSVSATSFAVPDVTGSKIGSSGGSSTGSSVVSQLPPGQLGQDNKSAVGGSSNGNANGKQPKKKLKCGDCGKEFSQLRNYRYHRSRHEGTDQFSCTCPVCGKQFNDRGYLSSHMKIHRNAKEYRCEYCTKGFNQRVAYNMHRRIHTGHRPHQCEVCGKSFSRRMLLKQHMRIHTGERPYSCGVCNKAFADRSNMLLHQRLHSGERPYVCEICKKSFSKNHHLKTHMNHHAGIKPYECPKCHARFSQSSNMKTHLKKCSGVLNPTTSQRQQMLRRNPLDIGRPSAQLQSLPSLPGVVAAAAAAAAAASGRGGEPLPPLSAASRLLYEQQSLNFLSQSIGSGPIPGVVGGPASVPPQLSPGHSRGQVPIESLLLHLNVSRSRHPSQGSVHSSAAPGSPTSSMSFPDLQLMLRNAAAVAAVSSSSGSRSISGPSNHGHRSFSSPSSPGSSSNILSTSAQSGGIPGMSTFSGMGITSGLALSNAGRRTSPVQGNMSTNSHELVSPPPQSPIMSMNPNLGMIGGRSVASHCLVDSTVMPPPPTNASSMRSMPTQSSFIPTELLSPQSGNLLRIDTRGTVDGYQTVLSPSEKSIRQGRMVSNALISPRRKQPSPPSHQGNNSFIPLSTLESAAIASGLKSPSQVVRLLSSALRDAEGPMPQNNQPTPYTRLPSLSHHNVSVLEAMVAAAAAEQNAAAAASQTSTRIRQVPSPPHHPQHHPQSHQVHSSQQFQFTEEVSNMPSLHINHIPGGSSGSHHHSNPPQHVAAVPSSFSVITSSHLLQQDQQQSLPTQQAASVRYSSSTSASRITTSAMAERHHHYHHPQNLHAPDQQLQVELHQEQPHQHRQHGYHQSLLLNHVSQSAVSQSPSSGYSSGSPGNSNSNSSYSTFSHSIIRSRSHSPGSIDHLRDRNQDYQNQS